MDTAADRLNVLEQKFCASAVTETMLVMVRILTGLSVLLDAEAVEPWNVAMPREVEVMLVSDKPLGSVGPVDGKPTPSESVTIPEASEAFVNCSTPVLRLDGDPNDRDPFVTAGPGGDSADVEPLLFSTPADPDLEGDPVPMEAIDRPLDLIGASDICVFVAIRVDAVEFPLEKPDAPAEPLLCRGWDT